MTPNVIVITRREYEQLKKMRDMKGALEKIVSVAGRYPTYQARMLVEIAREALK